MSNSSNYANTTNNLHVIIMAAGEGKRMRSPLPKVLHPFLSRPMLVRIIETARDLSPLRIMVIVGKNGELIRDTVSSFIPIDDVEFVQQPNPQGTGDAVKCCLPYISENGIDEKVLILNGDMPLINTNLLTHFLKSSMDMSILVANIPNPFGYGRIIYDDDGKFTEIVEEKDCTESQRQVHIVNAGIYILSSPILQKYIPKITNNNAQGEYYLTDIVKLIVEDNKVQGSQTIYINTFLLVGNENLYIRGVNTPEELAELERLSISISTLK